MSQSEASALSYPEQWHVSDLAEELIRLWELYFATPSTKKELKEEYQKNYNLGAESYNKRIGFAAMSIISKTTKDTVRNHPKKLNELPLGDKDESLKPKREGSVIQQIIQLHESGKTNKEIIALGFNKSTVGRQVSEFKKRKEQEKNEKLATA